MQGLPDRAAFNLGHGKHPAEPLRAHAKILGIQQHHRQPTGSPAPGRLRHEGNARQIPQTFLIALENRAAPGNARHEPRQLRQANRRQHRWQAKGIAGGFMLIMRRRGFRLMGQHAGAGNQPWVIRSQSPPAACGDDLIAIEGKSREQGAAPSGQARLGGAQPLGAVRNQRHAIFGADWGNLMQRGALAIDIHRHYGLGQPCLPRCFSQFCPQ